MLANINGSSEEKAHIRPVPLHGQGLSLAHTMGIQTGFITGRHSPAVAKRAQELKVTFVYLGQEKKTAAFEECVQKAGVTEDNALLFLLPGAGLETGVPPDAFRVCRKDPPERGV